MAHGCLKRALIALLFFATLPALAQLPQKPPEDPKFEIRRFVFDGATLIPSAQLEEATRGFTGKDRTFADVQRALETVERAYSRAGWSAVQVVLPEQELDRGEVRLQIVEAKVGRVIVEGNRFFDEANIRASVPALEPGKSPNIDAIARNLRVANESPAKQTTVLLRSGQEEATVDAVVRVTDETIQRGSITVDASGTKETGKFRVGFGYQNSNLWGGDEVLTLQYIGAPHSEQHPERFNIFPSKTVFIVGGGLRIPLYRRGDSIDFSAGYSNVSSGTVGGLFTITGAGGIFGARYNRNLDKIGDYEHRLSFGWDFRGYQNKGVRIVGSTQQVAPDVTTHAVSATYSGVFRRQDSETAYSIGVSQNLPGGPDGRGVQFCEVRKGGALQEFCAKADYMIWRWSVNHNAVIGSDWQFRLGLNGQLTRDMLVPGELFGIGGADSIRGFSERSITDDNGYRGTLELYTPDWGGKTGIAGLRARALAFLDWGGVWRNRPLPTNIHAQHTASAGFGARFARGNNMSLRVDYGWVLDEAGALGLLGSKGTFQQSGEAKLHFSFSYIY